jgi:hypothetical protein
VALPSLKSQFATIFDQLAIGMVGPGSDCFGYDDEISKDHDWGPAFCIFIPNNLYQSHAKVLSQWYDNLPKTYGHYKERVVTEPNRIGVINFETFYAMYTGLNKISPTDLEWLYASTEGLAVCTNGEVYMDRLGGFSAWRKALSRFPENIKKKKIASECFLAGQSGQYNFIRSLKRKDLFACEYAVVQFCSSALSIAFLLSDRYAPYYKWKLKAALELPKQQAKIAEWVEKIVTNNENREESIEKLSTYIISLLVHQNLATPQGDFLADYKPIVEQGISDKSIREMPGLY